MNEFLKNIFQWEGGPEITAFSIWHIMYLVLIVGGTILTAFILKNKEISTKQKLLNILSVLVVSIYVADFFFMPLSRANEDPTRQLIDPEKLPFHLCTFIGVMIPFAQFTKKENIVAKAFKEIVATLAIVASVMYIFYPDSAIGDIGVFNYKVVQTFLFHGLVFAWGTLSLTTGAVTISFKSIWKPLLGILAIMGWATLGNLAYVNELYCISGNWCFLRVSFFPFIPDALMPLVFFACVFGVCALVYCIDLFVKKILARKKESNVEIEK